MSKKMRSYRLDVKSIEQLEKIAAFYSLLNDDMFNRNVPVTVILETLIQKEFDLLKSKGYEV